MWSSCQYHAGSNGRITRVSSDLLPTEGQWAGDHFTNVNNLCTNNWGQKYFIVSNDFPWYCYKIVHMSRQHSCRDKCTICSNHLIIIWMKGTRISVDFCWKIISEMSTESTFYMGHQLVPALLIHSSIFFSSPLFHYWQGFFFKKKSKYQCAFRHKSLLLYI